MSGLPDRNGKSKLLPVGSRNSCGRPVELQETAETLAAPNRTGVSPAG